MIEIKDGLVVLRRSKRVEKDGTGKSKYRNAGTVVFVESASKCTKSDVKTI